MQGAVFVGLTSVFLMVGEMMSPSILASEMAAASSSSRTVSTFFRASTSQKVMEAEAR